MRKNWDAEQEKEWELSSYMEKGYYRLSLLKPEGYNDLPWYHEKVVSYYQVVGNPDLWNEVYSGNKEIPLSKVVGTSHDEYCREIERDSYTWIEMLGRLKKFYNNIDYILKGDVKDISQSISIDGYNGKYFITSNGNNRTIMMKFAGVDIVPIDRVHEYRDY